MKTHLAVLGLLAITLVPLAANNDTGEILVTTTPEKSEVFLESESVGISPVLISKLSPGNYTFVARNVGYRGSGRTMVVAGEVSKLHITLSEQKGRIFVRDSPAEAEAFLNGEFIGLVDDGLFEDLPVGPQTFEVTAKGLYATSDIVIEADRTVAIVLDFRPVGSIKFILPEKAVAVLSGANLQETITGTGHLKNIMPGIVAVEVTRPGYALAKIEIHIAQGETFELIPVLDLLPETKAEIERRELARRRELNEAERTRLLNDLDITRAKYDKLTIIGWLFAGFGGAAVTGAITTAILSFIPDLSEYKTALGGTAIGLGIAGGISGIIGAMVWFERPDIDRLESAILKIEEGD